MPKFLKYASSSLPTDERAEIAHRVSVPYTGAGTFTPDPFAFINPNMEEYDKMQAARGLMIICTGLMTDPAALKALVSMTASPDLSFVDVIKPKQIALSGDTYPANKSLDEMAAELVGDTGKFGLLKLGLKLLISPSYAIKFLTAGKKTGASTSTLNSLRDTLLDSFKGDSQRSSALRDKFEYCPPSKQVLNGDFLIGNPAISLLLSSMSTLFSAVLNSSGSQNVINQMFDSVGK